MSRRENKSVFILGASVMQIPAIKIAKELGWNVIVADGNSRAEGAHLADFFEHIDLKDREGLTEAAAKHREEEGLDGVFTAGTDFSANVAWVAEKLELPGIRYEVALDASDKSRMRRVFQDHSLPSPEFLSVVEGDELAPVFESLDLPVVIKPVDNMGARGVRRIDAKEELVAAAAEAFGYSRCSRIIVEEYIDGPEFSLDALVYRNQIFLCGLADRHIYFPPFFVEMGHTMPTVVDQMAQDEIIDVFFRGIKALGIHTGAAKGDIKLSPQGPVIGEIAARLSGGYMSGWTYPYSSGVRVTEGALRIAVGLPPGPLTPVKRHTAAERAFISIPGVVGQIYGDETARQAADEVFLRVSPGDTVRFPTNNVQKCGNVIAVDPLRSRAVNLAESVRRSVFLRLDPACDETYQFLYGDSETWIPPAFSISNRLNIEYLENMPEYISVEGDQQSSVGILALPALESENARDWHGFTVAEGLCAVCKFAGCSLESEIGTSRAAGARVPGHRIVLGRVFWTGFLKGGVQGGVWVVDRVLRYPGFLEKSDVFHGS
ncbi:MAG: ABC transporter permease [Spirochaetales bacterium]|nr:ABC transporter permease [Spirochaetales bacterium]